VKEKIEMPKKAKVGGLVYDIVYPYIFTENTMLVGLNELFATRIKISEYYNNMRRPKARIYETLVHELLHAIDNVYCNGVLSEAQITSLSSGWYSVIAENDLMLDKAGKMPKFVKVCGFQYKVEYPYTFTEEETWIASSSLHEQLLIRISNSDIDGIVHGHTYIKQNLVHQLTAAISSIKQVDTKDRNGDDVWNTMFMPMSCGIYQVIVDNKLDRLIRS